MANSAERAIDRRIKRARDLRRDMTDAEKKLWQRLRQPPFKAHHFRRQATIGRCFCDFASHGLKLVIEIDGGQHLDNSADKVRTAVLEKSGYRVLRFWNNDVLQNVEGAMTRIAAALGERNNPPPLTPPHRKRGEGNVSPSNKILSPEKD